MLTLGGGCLNIEMFKSVSHVFVKISRCLDIRYRYRNFKLFGYHKTFNLTQSHDEPTLHLAHVNPGADAGTCVVVEVAPGKNHITKIIILVVISSRVPQKKPKVRILVRN